MNSRATTPGSLLQYQTSSQLDPLQRAMPPGRPGGGE